MKVDATKKVKKTLEMFLTVLENDVLFNETFEVKDGHPDLLLLV